MAQRFQRQRMVDDLSRRGIRDQRVLDAMARVPREKFVKAHLQGRAYGDHALPIGDAQTISQPYVVARMTEMLALEDGHRVLEIGTGSGYQTAILALLVRWVFSLERIPQLAHEAIRRMRELGVDNVKIQAFDGSVGWSDMGPFDRILVTAASPGAPPPLLEQLVAGGRLVIPEGSREAQRLVTYDKNRLGKVQRREGEAVVFVPLLGRHGWQE